MNRKLTLLSAFLLGSFYMNANTYWKSDPREFRTELTAVITEDAINNSLYVQNNIPATFNGTFEGISYDMTANVQVKLKENQITARLIISGLFNEGSELEEDFVWIVSPSVRIPDISISTQKVIGFLEDIPNLIEEQEGPQFLKDIIIEAFEDLALEMYPKKLLEESNDLIPEFLDIEIKDIEFAFEVALKQLRLTVTIVSEVEAGRFWIVGNQNNGFTVHSTIETSIIDIEVYALNGDLINYSRNNNYDDWKISKGGFIQVSTSNLASARYVIGILFASPFGWYEFAQNIVIH